VLLRSAADLKSVQPGLAVLRELGVEHELIDAGQCRRLEPALAESTPLHAAVHLPRDGVGNCRQFAHLMKAHASGHGARFEFDRSVQGLRPAGGRVEVLIEGAAREFDAVVVCAGQPSAALLAPLRVKLPLLAVHGYSLTAPLRHLDGHADPGPRSGLMDERYKVAISRLGQRVRVAGSAEIGGRLDHIDDAPLRTLYKVLQDWFPSAADYGRAQHWKGARPMLPDGPPIIGPSGIDGLWLNLGHGSSGWALACGSARLLADRIAGRTPACPTEGFELARLQG
jgi:D-amino-acid dehydrogenase